MYRKALLAVAAALALAVLASCSGIDLRRPGTADELSAFEKIHRTLVGLHSYRAIATVEYRANKGSNAYETVQHARITGEYRVEVVGPEHVAGSITVNDGSTIMQFNKRVEGRVSVAVEETLERSEIFLTSFIKNYFLNGENAVSVMVADMEEGVRTVLEATIPGNHPYIASARLWVDNETLLPVKLIVFDPEGTERIIVTYHAFEMNVVLDDALFSM